MDARKPKLSSTEIASFTELIATLRKRHGKGVKDSLVREALTPKLLSKYMKHREEFDLSPQERWAIFSGQQGICRAEGCNEYTKWLRSRYGLFCCKKCQGLSTNEKRRKTCRKKYGVDHISRVPEVTAKRSRSLRAAHKAKGTGAKRKGKFEYVPQKLLPNTGVEFYTYLLLDPRKPGDYRYGRWKFDHEPFYVGKGKGGRAFDHVRNFDLARASNPHKNNKIRAIRELGLEPIICIKKKDISEAEAFELEARLIHTVGCTPSGPLTNVMRVQSGGRAGFTHTRKARKLLSEKGLAYWSKQTQEQRESRARAISRGKGGLTLAEYKSKLREIFQGRVKVQVPQGVDFRISHKYPHTCKCGTVRTVSPNYLLVTQANCQKCSRTGEAGRLRQLRNRATRAQHV